MKKQEYRPIIMVDVQEEFDRLFAHKYRLIGYLDDMIKGVMTPLRIKSILDRKSQIRDIDNKLDVLEKLFDVTAQVKSWVGSYNRMDWKFTVCERIDYYWKKSRLTLCFLFYLLTEFQECGKMGYLDYKEVVGLMTLEMMSSLFT